MNKWYQNYENKKIKTYSESKTKTYYNIENCNKKLLKLLQLAYINKIRIKYYNIIIKNGILLINKVIEAS